MHPLLLVLLVLILIGGVGPWWGYSAGWGYGPVGGVGLIVLILVIVLLVRGI